MSEDFSLDKNLIDAIFRGGQYRQQALRCLVKDKRLNQEVWESVQKMGGAESDTFSLIDDALIALTRAIAGDKFPSGKDVRAYILEKVKGIWSIRLGTEQGLRTQVMEYVSKDTTLKKRVLIKMNRLKCGQDEAEDYYNQGFVKMNEVFLKKKYKGGDVKGFFFRICENLRLNDLKKIKPVFPEDLPDAPDREMEKQLQYNEQKALLLKWIAQLSEKCRRTLILFNDGYSMQEIAAAIPYKDHLEAAVAKLRCLKKMMDLVDYRLWQKKEEV